MRDFKVFYGGTFDPVHNGHLAIARAARDALSIDGRTVQIRMIPAADPPHRAPPGASAAARVEMLRLAIDASPGLLLDRRELDRHELEGGGPSWTIDTLRAIRAGIGTDASIAWLIGADSFAGLPTWKCWRELIELTHFVVADRTGEPFHGGSDTPLSELVAGRWTDQPATLSESPGGLVYRLRQSLQPHSATDVRQRIAAGRPWLDLVPEAVGRYIVQNGLYGCQDARANIVQ